MKIGTGLLKAIKKHNEHRNKKTSAWDGPIIAGISQSLIQLWICCKERFRLTVIEGWKKPESFIPHLHYGSLWHVAEEFKDEDWTAKVKAKARELCDQFPTQQYEIEKWFRILQIQFPIYLRYYEEHEEENELVFTEQVFTVPIKLPSGRKIKLRGMVDGGFKRPDGKIWFQEHKVKGNPSEDKIVRQLGMDLQVMTYRFAVAEAVKQGLIKLKGVKNPEFAGVMYNVIRRPLSGGKGTIRRLKKCKDNGGKEETLDHYYGRLAGILESCPEEYFFRWDLEISEKSIDKFKSQVLFPILENIVDDYEWWDYCKQNSINPFEASELRNVKFPKHTPRHYILPFGVYNAVMEGRDHVMDDLILYGSTAGLKVSNNFFPELDGE